jgi:hypothetical protein
MPAITGHWIDDDWNLHESLLDFMHVEGHHYGTVLGEKVCEMLKEYDISEKLFCITTDGASNNYTMCKEISRRLKEEKDIEWNYKEMHIHCMNHVINLAVQEFLKSIKGIVTEAEEAALDSLEQDARDNAALPEGFALAMWKIRSITKVHSTII